MLVTNLWQRATGYEVQMNAEKVLVNWFYTNKKCGTNFTTPLSIEWPVGIQDKRHPETIDTGEKSTRSDMEDMPHIWETWCISRFAGCSSREQLLLFPSCSDSLLHLGSYFSWSWEQSSVWRPQGRFHPSPPQPLASGVERKGGFSPLASSFLECSRHSGSQAGLGYPYPYGI